MHNISLYHTNTPAEGCGVPLPERPYTSWNVQGFLLLCSARLVESVCRYPPLWIRSNADIGGETHTSKSGKKHCERGAIYASSYHTYMRSFLPDIYINSIMLEISLNSGQHYSRPAWRILVTWHNEFISNNYL